MLGDLEIEAAMSVEIRSVAWIFGVLPSVTMAHSLAPSSLDETQPVPPLSQNLPCLRHPLLAVIYRRAPSQYVVKQ